MDLKDIISISGKSGLFSVVGKSKNNVIVESVIDKKRFPIFNSNKISALSDISIYTYEEEVLLSDIYRKIFESNDGKKTISHQEDIKELHVLNKKSSLTLVLKSFKTFCSHSLGLVTTKSDQKLIYFKYTYQSLIN